MGEYTSLTLAQLREKAKLSASPNAYSARSWLSNANRTAAQAQQDDAAGERERAFVGYLKALQFFQAFLEHKEYARVKSLGDRYDGWGMYQEFMAKRSEYLTRAKELEGVLKGREVESAGGMSSVPLSPAPTASSTTATTKSEEPDTSTGGSIAARLAALKGAGMQVNLSTKRTSRDLSPHVSSPHTSSPLHSTQTPTTQQTFPSNGTDKPPSRRGSLASVNGLGMTPAPGTPRFEKENGLEGNKTGSSFNSIRSFERYQGQSQGQNHSQVQAQPQHQSQFQSHIPSQSQSQAQSSVGPSNASPRTPSLPIPPSPTSSSIRTLPTPPTSAPASGGRTSRSGSGSGPGFGSGPNGTANGNGKPEVIQEDEEMAYFSSAFPSLAELEEQVGGVEVGGRNGVDGAVNGAVNGLRSGAAMPNTAREGSSFSNSPVLDHPPPTEQRSKPPLPPTANVKPKSLSTNTAGAAATTAKPNLPFTNAIMPETLYGYMNDPALRLLVVDTRSGEDHQRGWIGGAGEAEKGNADCVWVDPTILSRPGYVCAFAVWDVG